MMPKDVLYISLHIPKTGGSTLKGILESQFGDRLQKAYKGHLNTPVLKNPDCIHGHDLLEMFGDVIKKQKHVVWFTFLREPLASAVSMYHYSRKRAKEQNSDAYDFDRCLEVFLTHDRVDAITSDKPLYNHNRYSKWLARHKKTIANLDFVGLTEAFDESMFLLYHRFGWCAVYYQVENKGAYEKTELPDDVVECFKQMNAQDYQLYDQAVELLARKKEAYGSDFESDLVVFCNRLKQRNRQNG